MGILHLCLDFFPLGLIDKRANRATLGESLIFGTQLRVNVFPAVFVCCRTYNIFPRYSLTIQDHDDLIPPFAHWNELINRAISELWAILPFPSDLHHSQPYERDGLLRWLEGS